MVNSLVKPQLGRDEKKILVLMGKFFVNKKSGAGREEWGVLRPSQERAFLVWGVMLMRHFE